MLKLLKRILFGRNVKPSQICIVRKMLKGYTLWSPLLRNYIYDENKNRITFSDVIVAEKMCLNFREIFLQWCNEINPSEFYTMREIASLIKDRKFMFTEVKNER
jgi:hypothetical protein